MPLHAPPNVPTLANFQTHTQVRWKNVKGADALNRRGRAICRIMSAHGGWSINAIAYIFNISTGPVSRAVKNDPYREWALDKVSDDGQQAGPEFQGDLPPPLLNGRLLELKALPKMPAKPKPKKVICAHATTIDYDSTSKDSEGESPNPVKSSTLSNQKRIREDEATLEAPSTASSQNKKSTPLQGASLAKKRRLIGPSVLSQLEGSTVVSESHSTQNTDLKCSAPALPHPPVDTPTRDQEPTLATVLKTITDVDLTPYHALLEAQGFTIARLRTVATWTPDEIHEGLKRLLMGSASALGHPGMPAWVFMAFESAVLHLRGKGNDPGPATYGPTMLVFLNNVMGLDLSPHAALLETQGVTLSALKLMRSWDPAEVQRVLRFTLLDPARIEERERGKSHVPGSGREGMCAVEVLTFEFCLRRARKEGA
ncbi:hypothetical protein B0H12DRAFT_1327165 [Mycena haematopus]|nr:hypothetical protein B0H12DRAFT_1327165 [Mycena haematopus]